MTESDMFWSAYPFLMVLLCLYPVLSRKLHVQRWNSIAMFLLSALMIVLAIAFMTVRVDVYFDGWLKFAYGTIAIAMFTIQYFLATVHTKYARTDGA